MTNVFKRPEKASIRRKLFELGEIALKRNGWQVERLQGIGKSSIRKISKGDERHVVAIRTTQGQWIAFPRKDNDAGWLTLDDVDFVVAVTVDDKDDPKEGVVYMVPGDEMRERFDRAYTARLKAGHTIPIGRGVWVSMFLAEDPDAASSIGGGIALGKKPLLSARLDAVHNEEAPEVVAPVSASRAEAPLTIADAKRRLAHSLGVAPEKIKIVIEA